MKLVPIYKLLSEGSINDFNFTYFLSDKFIIPFAKGEITSDNSILIDEFNQEYGLNLDETNIISHPKFKEFAINWIKNGINQFRLDTKDLISPSGKIKIYRGMSVKNNWLQHLESQGKRLGIYWSWTPDGAVNYTEEDYGNFVIIECEIDERHVNWETTVFQNIVLEFEREITLFKNTPLTLTSIKINDETINISSLKNRTFTS